MLCIVSFFTHANGTTFVLMDEEELASRSVAVITGTVSDVQTSADDSSGGVQSIVTVEPDSVIAGSVPAGQVIVRETGGRVADREEVVYGAPEYTAGERVLLFLSRNRDGSLSTTSMSMGKYRLDGSDPAGLTASRGFGAGVSVFRRSASGLRLARQRVDSSRLDEILARVRAADPAADYSAPITWQPAEGASRRSEYQASFAYMGNPARWFDPDNGLPVTFAIDPAGDPKVGAANSRAAVLQAFAVWSNISSTVLTLAEQGVTESQPFAGCSGGNRIVFNDPYQEITDPTNCGGILAIGGYCASWETQVINGTTFRRIGLGKVMLNNGWSQCAGWNACNLAEVLTHELGHAVGLGHSDNGEATMNPSAHFDGRCAALKADDIVGAQALYGDPDASASTPTPTPTPSMPGFSAPEATATLSTPVPTNTRKMTRTRTATRTRTPTKTKTPTRKISPTRTRTPWWKSPTPTPTRTAYKTRTPTRTRTRTRTRTATRTRTPTRTPQSSTGAIELGRDVLQRPEALDPRMRDLLSRIETTYTPR